MLPSLLQRRSLGQGLALRLQALRRCRRRFLLLLLLLLLLPQSAPPLSMQMQLQAPQQEQQLLQLQQCLWLLPALPAHGRCWMPSSPLTP
jgi:hypothetical protein